MTALVAFMAVTVATAAIEDPNAQKAMEATPMESHTTSSGEKAEVPTKLSMDTEDEHAPAKEDVNNINYIHCRNNILAAGGSEEKADKECEDELNPDADVVPDRQLPVHPDTPHHLRANCNDQEKGYTTGNKTVCSCDKSEVKVHGRATVTKNGIKKKVSAWKCRKIKRPHCNANVLTYTPGNNLTACVCNKTEHKVVVEMPNGRHGIKCKGKCSDPDCEKKKKPVNNHGCKVDQGYHWCPALKRCFAKDEEHCPSENATLFDIITRLNTSTPTGDRMKGKHAGPVADPSIDNNTVSPTGSVGDRRTRPFVKDAYDNVRASKLQNAKLARRAHEECVVENRQTDQWLAADKLFNAEDAAARKQALADALVGRVDQLKGLLKKLRQIQNVLKSHLYRVNGIFSDRHKMNMNDMHDGAKLLRDLGLVVSEPVAPTANPIKINPDQESPFSSADGGPRAAVSIDALPYFDQIKNATSTGASGATGASAKAPGSSLDMIDEEIAFDNSRKAAKAKKVQVAQSEADAFAQAEKAAKNAAKKQADEQEQAIRKLESTAASTSSFLETQEIPLGADMSYSDFVQASAGSNEAPPPACKEAHEKTFAIYRNGRVYNTRTLHAFEGERKTLGELRDTLADLIISKEMKVKKLEKQLAALRKSIASPAEARLESVISRTLNAHKAIISKQCEVLRQEAIQSSNSKDAAYRSIGKCGLAVADKADKMFKASPVNKTRKAMVAKNATGAESESELKMKEKYAECVEKAEKEGKDVLACESLLAVANSEDGGNPQAALENLIDSVTGPEGPGHSGPSAASGSTGASGSGGTSGSGPSGATGATALRGYENENVATTGAEYLARLKLKKCMAEARSVESVDTMGQVCRDELRIAFKRLGKQLPKALLEDERKEAEELKKEQARKKKLAEHQALVKAAEEHLKQNTKNGTAAHNGTASLTPIAMPHVSQKVPEVTQPTGTPLSNAPVTKHINDQFLPIKNVDGHHEFPEDYHNPEEHHGLGDTVAEHPENAVL
jgi:hypothetical protein